MLGHCAQSAEAEKEEANKTKFWTFKDSYVDTNARMCTRCGCISWFGDTAKLSKLRVGKAQKEKPANSEESE
jgi:hypothetical protein